jgi:hypothetical protein
MKMMSIRKRGGGSYEVGPSGIGPSVTVQARDKRDALHKAKAKLTTAQRDVIRVTRGKTR